MKLKKSNENPILSPNPKNSWESLVVCNPGAWYENERFYLLYRAAGADAEHVIRFGLAVSDDGVHFERVSDDPVFGPSYNGPDAGCVEDPRIVKYDNCYYITYAYRPYPPGRYWTFPHDEVLKPDVGTMAPITLRENITNSGLAFTRDFKSWRRLGRLTNPNLDDRDVILFPEQVRGKYVLLHRPKEWVGKEYNCDFPSIWIQYSDDLLNWEGPSHLLLNGYPGTWQEKIGGNAPPVLTDEGWLLLYHGVEDGGTGYYRVGAALLDRENPSRVIARTGDWIMEPDQDFELSGFYNGCVFPTGNVVVDDTLYIYYGGADKYVGLATVPVAQLVDYLKQECSTEVNI